MVARKTRTESVNQSVRRPSDVEINFQKIGQKRGEIKKAEGIKQARILEAEGEAEAIKLVNEAAEKYFVGNAQVLRKLEAVEKSLKENAKIVVPANSELVNVIGEMAGILPIKRSS